MVGLIVLIMGMFFPSFSRMDDMHVDDLVFEIGVWLIIQITLGF
jgi:hypothetical protein